MKRIPVFELVLLLLLCLAQGCANIVPPSGGKKDETPPQLLSTNPPDSQLFIKPKKLELRFDEYIVLNDAAKEIQVAPILSIPLQTIVANKKLTIILPDSLLTDSTTYRISFGKAIQDLHENNPFTGYQYVFSTGSYFDSLWLEGKVLQARTGLPDTGAFVLLYAASASDSIVGREKPLYTSRVDATGKFRIDGLPPRSFRVYALQDKNANLQYDGDEERVAFVESIIRPGIDTVLAEPLRTFQEIMVRDSTDEEDVTVRRGSNTILRKKGRDEKAEDWMYRVPVDTLNTEKRTWDVTKPLVVVFSRDVQEIVAERISLSMDSNGVEVPVPITVRTDTSERFKFEIPVVWREDAVYTLRLLKGFALDSAGVEAAPSKYRFRTKYEDDYAKLQINIDSQFVNNKHILFVINGADTVHHHQISEPVVRLGYLAEGIYGVYVIVDENGNGQWDTGDLYRKIQPEWVIPYKEPVKVRAGWEHIIDFKPPESK